MHIGIYKPFKKIFFQENQDETAAWSYEVVNLIKILERGGHTVKMITPCDDPKYSYDKNLMENPNSNLFEISFWAMLGKKITSYLSLFDRIIVVGGSFHLDKISEYEALSFLRKITPVLDLLITDQKLVPRNMESWQFFNNVYTQSTARKIVVDNGLTVLDPPVPDSKIRRSFTEELVLLDFNPDKAPRDREKTHDFYFGGGERGRSKSFFEFVYRPDHVLRIKSKSLKIDNRISFREHTDLLAGALATIVIADESYNKTGFVTPRQYEGWMVGTVVYTEKDYDPNGKIFVHDSQRRVESYQELREKITLLKEDQKYREKIVDYQFSSISSDMTSGENIYRALFH